MNTFETLPTVPTNNENYHFSSWFKKKYYVANIHANKSKMSSFFKKTSLKAKVYIADLLKSCQHKICIITDRATTRKQFTFFLTQYFCQCSFDWTWMNKRLHWSWSYPVVVSSPENMVHADNVVEGKNR